jgi:peptidoglycan lytic transglycosylase
VINFALKILGVVGLSVFLVACSDITEKRDSAPSKTPDVTNIPDAVPKNEPRSKHGNASSYEVFGKRYYTLKSSKGYRQKGVASWYGTKFHGRRTSSGEPYDMYAMTAAHKTLPLPTYVEVTNLNNGRKVVVKVNDRGPFHGDRLIDLSYSAATKLGIVGKGTGLVEVRAIFPGLAPVKAATSVKHPVIAGQVGLYLQVGAFKSSTSAERLKTKLQQQIGDAILIVPSKQAEDRWYRVRVGPLENVAYGDALASRLVDLGFNDTHIVVE